MTSPDQYFPDTAINASPGFSAYAGTTQEDYEEMMNDQWVGLSGPLSGVCELLGMLPCLDGLLQMGDPNTNGTTGGLMQGSQNFADGLCSIHNDITGETSTASATPAAVTAGVQDAAAAATGTPFAAGIVEMGQTSGSSGNAAVDAAQGAQEFANQLYGVGDPCGCGSQFSPTGDGGVTPTTIINTAQDTADTVQNSPFAMGILAMGQEPEPSGNPASDAISGGQGFADSLFNIFGLCGCSNDLAPQQATPQAVLDNSQQVADAYAASPMATGIVAMGQEPEPSGNAAVDAISGGQAFTDSLFNICGLCGCGEDNNPRQATPEDIIGTAQDTADTLATTPITAGVLAMGQVGGSSGNVAKDATSGLQTLVNAICGSSGNATGQDTSAADIAIGAANLSSTVQATPFTAGLMEMSSDDSNGHAGKMVSGLQNFLDNLCHFSSTNSSSSAMSMGAGPVYGSATPTAILQRLGALNDAIQTNPYYTQAMSYVPDQTGQTEVDLHNAATAWASEFYALQAIENPAYHAVDPSLTAVFNISALTADAPSQIDVTAAAGTAIGFVYMIGQADKNSIAWIGYGKTNITHLYARIYSVDTEAAHLDRVWTSPDLVGSIPDSLDWIYVPLDETISTAVGEWYALEIEVQGTGTHTMVGMPDHWLASNEKVFPQKLAATRPNAQDPAIPFAPTYSPNVPWLALSSALAVQTLTMTAPIATAGSVPTAVLSKAAFTAGFPCTFPITLPDGYAASGPPPANWAAGRQRSFAWQNLLESRINAIGAGTTPIPKAVQPSSATSLSLTVAFNVWEYTGSAAAAWTVPAVSGNTNAVLTLTNAGSAAVTVSRAGSDHLYQTESVTAVTIPPGDTATLINDGTYWLVA